MARILADVPQPEPTNEAEAAQRVAQRMTDNMGPPFDYGAKWTDATYVPAVSKAVSDALRFPGDTAEKALWWGLRILVAGLFLWLLFEPTLGRLLRWIRHGSAPHV